MNYFKLLVLNFHRNHQHKTKFAIVAIKAQSIDPVVLYISTRCNCMISIALQTF